MKRQKPYGMIKKTLILIVVFILSFTIISPGNGFASEKRFNMSYVYFGSTSSYISYVESTRNSLNEISPSYFDLNSDGTLKLTAKLDEGFIEEMHEKGIKVVPFLSNHWDRDKGRQALTKREALAQQIANAVVEYNLDGINVDIENMNENDRDNYTDFVRLLREKLPPGSVVAVAVAPNPYNTNTGWQGSYDYSALANYSDYLMVMAYDEHYQGSAPGPAASAPFIEKSIKYAIARVPSRKIVLGIPFYGRFWKNGVAYGGYGISASDAEALVRRYKGSVVYDTELQAPKSVINIKFTDPKPYVFGSRLSTGKYTIWYENSRSIKYKLGLVQKYNLKGTGSWSLGQESPNTWNYYSMWLNGIHFYDVEGHWAQNAILQTALNGWMKGITTTQFLPDAALTRAQAAVILVRALGLEGETAGIGFPDTAGHWAEKEIALAKGYNIVTGDDSGNFNPEAPVSREQMAVMLDRILPGLESAEEGLEVYKDVSPDSPAWAYSSIIKVTHNGIFNGYPDGNFYPRKNITRAQMATLMSKIEKFIRTE